MSIRRDKDANIVKLDLSTDNFHQLWRRTVCYTKVSHGVVGDALKLDRRPNRKAEQDRILGHVVRNPESTTTASSAASTLSSFPSTSESGESYSRVIDSTTSTPSTSEPSSGSGSAMGDGAGPLGTGTMGLPSPPLTGILLTNSVRHRKANEHKSIQCSGDMIYHVSMSSDSLIRDCSRVFAISDPYDPTLLGGVTASLPISCGNIRRC